MLFEEKVTPQFATAVKAMSARLGMIPDYVMAVMAFESNFSPSVHNPLSSATGLIQFMESTAKGLGTTTAALANMTAVDQLYYVEKYFKNQIATFGALKTLADTYLAVFYPAAIGKPQTYQFSKEVANVNPVFDVDRDGVMTKQDVTDYITTWVEKRGGVIQAVEQYNNYYIAVTVVGVAVMVLYGLKKYYPHLFHL